MKSEKLFKSYRVNKSLRPAAARAAARAAAPAPAYERAQKHKVTPSILGWLNYSEEWTENSTPRYTFQNQVSAAPWCDTIFKWNWNELYTKEKYWFDTHQYEPCYKFNPIILLKTSIVIDYFSRDILKANCFSASRMIHMGMDIQLVAVIKWSNITYYFV